MPLSVAGSNRRWELSDDKSHRWLREQKGGPVRTEHGRLTGMEDLMMFECHPSLD